VFKLFNFYFNGFPDHPIITLYEMRGESGFGAGSAAPVSLVLQQLGGRRVLLFDGICRYCNAWVRFVVKNDPQRKFAFASMSSAAGERLLSQCGPQALWSGASLILLDECGYHTDSTAALRVLSQLAPKALPTGLSLAGHAIPRWLRESIYETVSESMRRKDTRKDHSDCHRLYADSPRLADRFLDLGESTESTGRCAHPNHTLITP
tara:strand:+ start:223 stop:843 length:621 start_codon:yes stop_codon:yes gene_type:complete